MRARRIRVATVLGLTLACAPASLVAAERERPAAPVTRLPPLPPAVIDETLAIGGSDIAARKVETRMTVAVQLEGRGPFRFVVDSGADSSALSLPTARMLQLAAGTPVMLHGMTASARVERVKIAELNLGQSVIRDLELPLLDEQDLGSDGLLGIDALVEQRLMMDFDKRVITVEDARRPAVSVGNEVVVTARRRRGQLILTEASVGGRKVDAVIDTGSEITIGNLALRDLISPRVLKSLPVIEIVGVTGVAAKLQMARLADFKVGPILMHDVPIAFADVPPFASFGLDDHPALLLGTDLMANFRRVSLDFRARKVRFQLKRCGSTGVLISTTDTFSRMRSTNAPGAGC